MVSTIVSSTQIHDEHTTVANGEKTHITQIARPNLQPLQFTATKLRERVSKKEQRRTKIERRNSEESNEEAENKKRIRENREWREKIILFYLYILATASSKYPYLLQVGWKKNISLHTRMWGAFTALVGKIATGDFYTPPMLIL